MGLSTHIFFNNVFMAVFDKIIIIIWASRGHAARRKVAGSIPDCVIGIFYWHNPSRPHYVPEVDSASNRNEYQEYFMGVKAAGA
jgi:hypothetical protein